MKEEVKEKTINFLGVECVIRHRPFRFSWLNAIYVGAVIAVITAYIGGGIR
jgi:hypothetical protein